MGGRDRRSSPRPRRAARRRGAAGGRVATLIDTGRRHVVLESGDELPGDRLVYAVGSTSKSGFEHAFTVGDWESAQRLREHLATERGR